MLLRIAGVTSRPEEAKEAEAYDNSLKNIDALLKIGETLLGIKNNKKQTPYQRRLQSLSESQNFGKALILFREISRKVKEPSSTPILADDSEKVAKSEKGLKDVIQKVMEMMHASLPKSNPTGAKGRVERSEQGTRAPVSVTEDSKAAEAKREAHQVWRAYRAA